MSEFIPYRILMPLLSVCLCAFATELSADEPVFHAVKCTGNYPHHLQGVCTDNKEAIYWSFTTRLVKTDRDGKILKQIEVGNHHGDLCFHDGKIYVAVNFGPFNDPDGKADSWIYIYNADDLSQFEKQKTPEVIYGAGGIAYHDGTFLVVGGLPDGTEENYLYDYDENFQFRKKHVLKSGWTQLGIQTATFADGYWWFGCYGNPEVVLKADTTFEKVERFEFSCSLGIVPIGENRFLTATGRCVKEIGCSGQLRVAIPDEKRGLVIQQ